MASGDARRLMDALGLDEGELCSTLGTDPLTLLSGEPDDYPEVAILLDLLADARERAGEAMLRRWVRAPGPSGRPVEMLIRRDFAAFEDALATLAERGFVLRGGGAAG